MGGVRPKGPGDRNGNGMVAPGGPGFFGGGMFSAQKKKNPVFPVGEIDQFVKGDPQSNYGGQPL